MNGVRIRALPVSLAMLALSVLGGTLDGQTWEPPRTAWGDPDISGTFTNKDEQGIPLERPIELGARLLLNDEEFEARQAAARLQMQLDVADFQAVGTAGTPPGFTAGTAPDPVFNDRGQPSRRTSRIIDPPNGRIPALTDAGRQRVAKRDQARAQARRESPESYRDFSLFERCITRGLPGSMMPAVYGNSYEIVQAPGYVAIRYEMVHETRIIPVDGGPHLSPSVRLHMGDGRGSWDGDTLVVESTNFRPESAYQGANAEALRIIERFTPASPTHLTWSVTVDDPTTWTASWTFEVRLTRDPSQRVLEYACHEGNYGLRNVLSTVRTLEAR